MEYPQFLPPDINIEVLLSYYRDGQLKVSLQGLHKRNTYNDIIDTEMTYNDDLHITVGRLSLYNSLPEFMFHPIDRFDNLPKHEEKERFREQMYLQEEEIANAFHFFAPVDTLLLKLRADVRERLEALADDNIVLQQIIGDSLTDEQRSNRLIKKMLPFLPYCRHIRGNRTLLSIVLRKVFMDEGLTIEKTRQERTLTDGDPRYNDRLDMVLGDSYVGNTYTDSIACYDIHYWSDEEANEHFMEFIDSVEQLRLFIKDYFLSVEEDITFNICHDDPPLRLSDTVFYNYLNYNTNI